MNFVHETVLLKEAVDGLNVRPDGIYVDCTLGGGGHSQYLASKLSKRGRLIAFDQDVTALQFAKEKLADYRDQITFVKSNFRFIKQELESIGCYKVDGILYDLGVSSPQLDTPERGSAIIMMLLLICGWISMGNERHMKSSMNGHTKI